MINFEALTARSDRYNSVMWNLFKGYLAAGEKYFVRYIQHQKYKHNDGDNIDKYKLMMLAHNRYTNLCIKDKWLSKSH